MNATTIALGSMGAVITALSGIVIALIAARTNHRTTAVTWAATLVDRLEAVEAKVSELETALTKSQRALQAAVRFIDRLVDWGRRGGKSVMPRPPKTLHEYLDADSWDSGDLDDTALAPPSGGEAAS